MDMANASRKAFMGLSRLMAPLIRRGLVPSTRIGGSMCVLRTHGRQTGKVREVALDYASAPDGGIWIMAGWGAKTRWYLNLLADPAVEVTVGRRTRPGTARPIIDPGPALVAKRAVLLASGLAGRSGGLDPGSASDERLALVYDGSRHPRLVRSHRGRMPAHISIDRLTKHYVVGHDRVVALDNVSLSIEPGSMVAVMGPSGSGKSTLMNLLGLLDTPTSGSYRIGDAEVAGLSDAARSRERRERIGFIFQSFNLLPRKSALENVAIPLMYAGVGRAERLERSATLLRQVGLGDRMRHRPTELSGGQQQRVAIARALVNEPALILADEPTGNLDSQTGREVLTMLRQMHAAGRTIVVVTHDRAVAEVAQRIVTLVDGRIVSDELVDNTAGGPAAGHGQDALAAWGSASDERSNVPATGSGQAGDGGPAPDAGSAADASPALDA